MLRPLAFSTLADLVMQVRTELPFPKLQRAVFLFLRNIQVKRGFLKTNFCCSVLVFCLFFLSFLSFCITFTHFSPLSLSNSSYPSFVFF